MSHEVKYWERTGLPLGTERYRRYLDLFGLDRASCRGLAVCDYGCGPFGGVLSILTDVRQGYPVDILADFYNTWRLSPWPILDVPDGRAEVPDASCDAAFCLNMLDHMPNAEIVVRDIERILRPHGRLFAFVHVGRDRVKAHHPVTQRSVMALFSAWRVGTLSVGADAPNQEPSLTALWFTAERA